MFITELINAHEADYTGVQSFVFKSTGICIPVEMIKGEVLACPFDYFSIEVDGTYITQDINGNIACILCKELAPDDYLFTLLICVDGFSEKIAFEIEKSEDEYLAVLSIVHSLLSRLHVEKKGVINSDTKARFKDKDGKKRVFKPSNVIYVSPTLSTGAKTSKGQYIKHTPAWTVRAHWRSIDSDGLGVDRLGYRTVKGFTWINSHIKGDNSDIKPKIRKVS